MIVSLNSNSSTVYSSAAVRVKDTVGDIVYLGYRPRVLRTDYKTITKGKATYYSYNLAH